MVERTVTAEAVEREYAPPATTLRHERQLQIPALVRLTLIFPQKTH